MRVRVAMFYLFLRCCNVYNYTRTNAGVNNYFKNFCYFIFACFKNLSVLKTDTQIGHLENKISIHLVKELLELSDSIGLNCVILIGLFFDQL